MSLRYHREMTENDAAGPLCAAVRTTRGDLAQTLGLAKTALSQGPAGLSSKARSRLGEFQKILRRLEPLTGSAVIAFAYYRGQPIPEFGGRTAEALVKEGRASRVQDFLDHAASGGFA